MMGFKKFQNVPFGEIPKEDRVKQGELEICKGGCNRLSKMWNTTYQLCDTCGAKWRYHGYDCDVPNCESVADGSIKFRLKENKMVCIACYQSWRKMNFCIWERYVEKRHLYFLRPETFVKALEYGIVSVVKKENRVKNKEVAECHHCYREKGIGNPTYQLCSTCMMHLQHLGESCGVCEVKDANYFDEPESIFVCCGCATTKRNYKITSYHIYKTQIRTIYNCQICKTPISHDAENGNRQCSAYIDHDHDTDITRGVICQPCNSIEGYIKKIDITSYTYATRLKNYLENPPLDQSWTQDL